MISTLETLTPPAVEPISNDTAAAHLRLDTVDPMVPIYVSAARAWAETYTARALISQQLLWTLAASPQPGGWPLIGLSAALLVLPQWLSPNQIGVRPLTLPRQPLISLDSVVTGQWGQAQKTLTTDQYGVNLSTGQLNVYSGMPLEQNGYLGVTFTVGYGASGGQVPIQILQAILLMTAFLYEQRGDAGGDPPPAAKMLLNPYRLVTFG